MSTHEPTPTQEYVIVGQIGATYGVKGWLKILSYTDITADILDYTPWYIEHSDGWKAIEVEEGCIQGKGLIAKLSGLNNPEEARLISGKKIAILRSQLPDLPQGEYYWSDLKGLTVINQKGKCLGTVSYLIETGSNDVMVVKGEEEIAIPYLPQEVVTRVDLAKGEIHVNWEVV